MTSNIKITRDLSVGGGRVGWCKNKKSAQSSTKHCYKIKNKPVQKRMKKLARQLKNGSVDMNILSFWVFPPPTPRNTTQFLIERHENDQHAPSIIHPQPLDFAFSYGSMVGVMDCSTTQSCRMNAISECLDGKFHQLELTNWKHSLHRISTCICNLYLFVLYSEVLWGNKYSVHICFNSFESYIK